METYKEVLKYEEPEAVTYFYIGECYEKLEHYSEAFDYYRRSSKLNPEYAEAWMGMGSIHDKWVMSQQLSGIIKKSSGA